MSTRQQIIDLKLQHRFLLDCLLQSKSRLKSYKKKFDLEFEQLKCAVTYLQLELDSISEEVAHLELKES